MGGAVSLYWSILRLTRFQVISTCQHIKIRLAGNQGIILPVAALLKQYKEHADSSMIRHFDLMFIQQSVGKLSSSVSIVDGTVYFDQSGFEDSRPLWLRYPVP